MPWEFEFPIQDLWLRLHGSGFMVIGSLFMVHDSGSRGCDS